MTFTKIASSLAIALTLAATPALAGNKSMKNADGTKLRINCASGNCKVTQKPKGAKWKTIEKAKAANGGFDGLVAKYQALGFD